MVIIAGMSETGDTANLSRQQSWLVLGLVVALPCLTYPLAWLPRGTVSHRFDLDVPISLFYLVAVLALAAWHLWSSEETQLPSTRMDRLVLAVVGVGFISALLSSNFHFSLSAWILLFANATLLYVTAGWFNLRYRQALGWLWLATAFAQAVYALLQVHNGGYPWGTIGNRDWMAGYLGASLFVAIPSVWPEASKKPVGMALVVIGGAVILGAFVVCNSLGAWLGLGAALFACVVRWLWGKHRLSALAFVAFVAVVLGAVAALNHSRLYARWLVDVRPPIWKGTLDMVGTSLLIGHGVGTFPYQYAPYRPPEYFNTNVLAGVKVPEGFKQKRQPANYTDHAHNEFLEISAEMGTLGLLIMIWVFGTVLLAGWRSGSLEGPDRWFALGSWGAVILLLVHNQFDINLRRPPNQALIWMLMGLVMRAAPVPAKKPEPEFGIVIGRREPEGEPAPASSLRPERLLKIGACLVLIIALVWLQVFNRLVANDAWRHALIERDQVDLQSKPPSLSLTSLSEKERDHVQAAMENYLRCLKHDPFRVDAWFRLAYLCARFSETDGQAIDYYLQVTDLAPDYGEVNTNLAYLFLKRDKKREAIPYLQRAIALNPYRIDLRIGLAQVYLELNLARDVKEQILEILSLDPHHPWANGVWDQYFKQESKDLPAAPRTTGRLRTPAPHRAPR